MKHLPVTAVTLAAALVVTLLVARPALAVDQEDLSPSPVEVGFRVLPSLGTAATAIVVTAFYAEQRRSRAFAWTAIVLGAMTITFGIVGMARVSSRFDADGWRVLDAAELAVGSWAVAMGVLDLSLPKRRVTFGVSPGADGGMRFGVIARW